jgi:Na+-transporting NADH:ubiquinone oxidoreductase subunit NqrA
MMKKKKRKENNNRISSGGVMAGSYCRGTQSELGEVDGGRTL